MFNKKNLAHLSPLSSLLSSLYKHQTNPRPDSQEDDQHGLDGVDDEDKVERFCVGNAVENEHGLHGEVPGAGTVGSRYDDCNAADNEGHHSTGEAEVSSEVETEEGEVVM